MNTFFMSLSLFSRLFSANCMLGLIFAIFEIGSFAVYIQGWVQGPYVRGQGHWSLRPRSMIKNKLKFKFKSP